MHAPPGTPSEHRTSKRRRPAAVLALCAAALTACGEPCADEGPPLAEPERRQFTAPLTTSAWDEPGSWPQFGHDPLHTGRSDVDLGNADLVERWQFRPGTHVWSYEPGHAVWSPPVCGRVDGRTLVFAGHYDRAVYAVDASTGTSAWVFAAGEPVFAAPALGRVDGRALLFVASTDRSIYALDAATGEQVWSFETAPWTFTRGAAAMASPTLVHEADRVLVIAGVWNTDRSATGSLQEGEVLALDAAEGSILWRRRLATVPITSPAVVRLHGERLVLVAAHHGGVWVLALADGRTRWRTVLNEETRSSPSLALAGDRPRLLIGSRFHSLIALDLGTGRRCWRRQTGYWIDATPAWLNTADGTMVAIGSYDRSVHAIAAGDGAPRWTFETGNFAYATPAIAWLAGRPVVIAQSWDEHVYLLDGATGEPLWQGSTGPLLWTHASEGDSLWSSPAVAQANGVPLVLAGGVDGVLYAWGPRPAGPERAPDLTEGGTMR